MCPFLDRPCKPDFRQHWGIPEFAIVVGRNGRTAERFDAVGLNQSMLKVSGVAWKGRQRARLGPYQVVEFRKVIWRQRGGGCQTRPYTAQAT